MEGAVAEGDDGTDVVSIYEKNQPDVVLMDINMPEMNGFEIIKRIRSEGKTIPINC